MQVGDDGEHCIILITSINMQMGNNYGLEINGRWSVNPEEIKEVVWCFLLKSFLEEDDAVKDSDGYKRMD